MVIVRAAMAVSPLGIHMMFFITRTASRRCRPLSLKTIHGRGRLVRITMSRFSTDRRVRMYGILDLYQDLLVTIV